MTRKRWMAALLCLLMVVAIPAPLLADPADPVTESGTATETVADPAGETETTEPVATDAETAADVDPASETEDALVIQTKDEPAPPEVKDDETEEEETEPEPEPEPYDYTVEYALSNGSFQVVKDYEKLSDAVAAAKADRTEAVVRDAKRTRGNGVVYMNQGIVITDPSRSKADHVLLTFGTNPHVSYTGAGYDALFVSGDGENVSIRLMGMEGPVHKAGNLNPVDQVELIPSVHRPAYSYYMNNGGSLVHYVQQFSYHAKENRYTAKAFPIELGEAPSFMAEYRPYYSYNAQNYYTSPYATGSVGYFEPYYKMLPMRSYTNYTAADLNRYIASWNLEDSMLNGTGEIFIHVQNKTGVNAAMLLSMAAHESAKGTSRIAKDKNNLFGINATDANPYSNADDFYSIAHNIEYQAKVKMNDQYLNHADDSRYRGPQLGDKYSGMNVKYASDPYWGEKIVGHMVRLDAFLGNKDANKYAIGWVKTPSFAYSPEGWPEAAAYPLHSASFKDFVPVIVTGQKDDYYIARGIMPLKGPLGDIRIPYEKEHHVYIARANMGTIRGGVSDPKEPAQPLYMYMERVAGKNRFETSVAISKRYTEKADTVILANGPNEIDALSAAPLAGFHKAPILLVRANEIPEAVKEEISRLGAKNVIIVGGTEAVSKQIEDALEKDKLKVTRLFGQNRYDTGAAISKEVQRLLPNQTKVFVANGQSAVDAMSIGPVAAKEGIPILLTNGTTLTANTKEILKKADGITLLGLEKAITPALEKEIKDMKKTTERIGGANRSESAVKIAETYFENPQFAVITRGDNALADGLAGSVLAASYNAPLLPVGTTPNAAIKAYLRDKHGDELFVLGGEEALTLATANAIANMIERD